MPRMLRCPQGHEWEPMPGDPTRAGSALCPICGQQTLTTDGSGSTVAAPPAGPDSTPRLEAYEVLEEIGRGGMGIVYRARHREHDRLVALKIIRRDRLNNPDAVARFRREARAAARLSHPNIVLLFESDQEGDVHYLAMELVPGVTLQEVVEKDGPLPVDLACDYLRQAALGLQHAHEQALIHRDIKPSNLMVSAERGARSAERAEPALRTPRSALPILKILDMGVARLHQLQHEDTITTLTQQGAVIGTPDYIAPEQVENPHRADVRADLYSLGCTAYYLLTGDVPFPGGNLIQKLDRQRWEVPPSVDQIREDVPGEVAAVVRRLMEKDPGQRFQTPGELADALEELARTGRIAALHRRAPLVPTVRLTGHAGSVLGLCFLPGDQVLVSGGKDRTLRTWRLSNRSEAHRMELPREVTAVGVSLSGTAVAVAAGVGLRLIEPASGEERQRFTGHRDTVRSVAVSPDGRLVASGSDDHTVRVWDAQTGRPVHRLVRHADVVTTVAFSSDGRWLLSSGRDQALLLWDVQSGRLGREFAAPRGAVTGAAFCSDELHLVSGHFDTTVRVWDRETGREMRRLQGHRQMVTAVACSVDGRLVSGSNDRVVRLWDPVRGSEIAHGEAHAAAVLCLAVSSDGSILATGGADGTICLWDLSGI